MSFALLVAAPQQAQTIVRDSTRRDSTAAGNASGRRPPAMRRAVTADLRASAFADSAARDLFTRARVARGRQDSSLLAYDATVVQRLTVKAAIGKVPLEKLMYRQDNSAHVLWDRAAGAHIEVTGARVAIPPAGSLAAERDVIKEQLSDPDLIPVPYFPGAEPLWAGMEVARAQVNDRDVVNPLADGAEAYYTYRARDAFTLRMGDGRTITVQQMDVKPREAASNLVIGSLWIDRASGQLVRAAYRQAAPAEAQIDVRDAKGISARAARILGNMFLPRVSADLNSVVVEYELYDGYWLPRSQTAEGTVSLSFARVPVTFDNRFSYASVNRSAGLGTIAVDSTSRTDSAWRAQKPQRDSARRRADSTMNAVCDTGTTRIAVKYNRHLRIPVEMRSPCKVETLANSPDLPKSIYDPGDEVFEPGDAARLIRETLSMTQQPPFSLTHLPSPALHYGLSMTRYNRVEGWSTGIDVDQQLGAGLDVGGAVRAGTARSVRWEANAGRSNGEQAIRLGGYDRLVSVDERSDPLSLGASLSGFFFGRDDALYYMARGAELRWRIETAPHFELRLFADRESSAPARVARPLSGSFVPDLAVSAGTYRGGSIDWTASHGIDPGALRFSSAVRVEMATADLFYARGSVDLLATRPLFSGVDGSLSTAVGSSLGALPAHRQWYLGGTGTVRGERPDPMRGGNAFWLARAEAGPTVYAAKPTIFGDIGWTGDRDHLDRIGRPTSGVGVGLSLLDGILRLDLARGIYPERRTQLSFYLGSIF